MTTSMLSEVTSAQERAWVVALANKVRECKEDVKTINGLIDEMEHRGYMITYPDTFKKAYWGAEE